MAIPIDLSGRIAVITGVTSGLGAGIAKAMAEAGCDVIGSGSRGAETDGAKAFVESVEAEGRRAEYIPCDVTKPEAIMSLRDDIAAKFDRVDILISNAGLNVLKNPLTCEMEDWDFNHNLNLRSHWLMVKTLHGLMEKSESPVIQLMTSVHGLQTLRNCFPYNVAKAGIMGMVREMALDLAPKIRTVGIAPGFIVTESTEDFLEDPEMKKGLEEGRPVCRLGNVNEVGALCAFLASDLAGYISGETIVIDGGKMASIN
jgi:NAD(P)-dependent dehydrogenase (short-subunit alcohol dehydrogenase family)